MSKIYILNQYYIDLIKKLKSISKKHKEKSKTAKNVINKIKENYLTLDNQTDEYYLYLKSILTDNIYNSYKTELLRNNSSKKDENEKDENENEKDENEKDENEKDENVTINEDDINTITSLWLDNNSELELIKGIKLVDIKKVLRDDYICHQFISIFLILTRDNLTDENATIIVNLLQKINYDNELKEMEDEEDVFKTILDNLQHIKQQKIKKSVDMNMGGMENTTLGKLAKEILEDVDVNKLQKSMGENGDVLKSLSDPDSGFGDIISSVSQKMASKLSSGELNQENLMKDAMKFATMMPGMFGNQGGGGGGGGRGGSGGGGANMGNMMNMFADLMSNNNENEMPDINTMRNMSQNMAGKQKKGTKSGFNEGSYRKIAAQKKLKKKIAQKKSTDS